MWTTPRRTTSQLGASVLKHRPAADKDAHPHTHARMRTPHLPFLFLRGCCAVAHPCERARRAQWTYKSVQAVPTRERAYCRATERERHWTAHTYTHTDVGRLTHTRLHAYTHTHNDDARARTYSNGCVAAPTSGRDAVQNVLTHAPRVPSSSTFHHSGLYDSRAAQQQGCDTDTYSTNMLHNRTVLAFLATLPPPLNAPEPTTRHRNENARRVRQT